MQAQEPSAWERVKRRYRVDPATTVENAFSLLSDGVQRAIWRLLLRRRFRAFGKSSAIIQPRLLNGTRFMSIGAGVYIRSGARLEAIRWIGDSIYTPSVQIGDGCFFEFDFQLSCASRISIGRDVLAAGRVFITDNDHGRDPKTHRLRQPILTAPVDIGNYVWLGQNACILKGVSLGDGCIVAAGAVVTKSFAAGSIIGGVPARKIGDLPNA